MKIIQPESVSIILPDGTVIETSPIDKLNYRDRPKAKRKKKRRRR